MKRLLTRQVRQKLIDGDEVGSRSTAELEAQRDDVLLGRHGKAEKTPAVSRAAARSNRPMLNMNRRDFTTLLGGTVELLVVELLAAKEWVIDMAPSTWGPGSAIGFSAKPRSGPVGDLLVLAVNPPQAGGLSLEGCGFEPYR